MATFYMVIDNPYCLHIGIYNCTTTLVIMKPEKQRLCLMKKSDRN